MEARKIVVTSGKGGVGKTSVVAGVGAALARAGCRVCVMDTDIGLNNLDVTLGVESHLIYDITDVINGRCRPRQALVEIPACPDLYLMPSCHGYENKIITGQALKQVVNALGETFDFILIDCPAGIEAGFKRSVAAAEEALVVSTPHITALRDADKVIGLLSAYEPSKIGLVVNRVRGDLELRKDNLSLAQISDLLCCHVVGAIPEDDAVGVSCGQGQVLPSETASGKAYKMLANYLMGKEENVYDATDRYKGLFGGIKRRLRRIV